MRLTTPAAAKVNLCLFLGGTRADGRHELVTLFQSLTLADEVELELNPDAGEDRVVCPGVEGENLAARALAALRASGWAAPPVLVTIVKRVPVAAGMGGGSADAAAVLRLAGAVAEVPHEQALAVAAELGADVASQLAPGLSIGTGAGERVERRPPLARHAYVVLPSAHALSTAEVYREADRLGLARPAAWLRDRHERLLAALGGGGARLPSELIVNELQPAALSLHPPIAAALDAAVEAGAAHAIVSGSGPTVVGIWWGEESHARAVAAAAGLARDFPGAVAAEPVTAAGEFE
jgi:4-diphosphocytidyl-2-C-methyl-D-erythritol kinase